MIKLTTNKNNRTIYINPDMIFSLSTTGDTPDTNTTYISAVGTDDCFCVAETPAKILAMMAEHEARRMVLGSRSQNAEPVDWYGIHEKSAVGLLNKVDNQRTELALQGDTITELQKNCRDSEDEYDALMITAVESSKDLDAEEAANYKLTAQLRRANRGLSITFSIVAVTITIVISSIIWSQI